MAIPPMVTATSFGLDPGDPALTHVDAVRLDEVDAAVPNVQDVDLDLPEALAIDRLGRDELGGRGGAFGGRCRLGDARRR